jgi:hypothetical protein
MLLPQGYRARTANCQDKGPEVLMVPFHPERMWQRNTAGDTAAAWEVRPPPTHAWGGPERAENTGPTEGSGIDIPLLPRDLAP